MKRGRFQEWLSDVDEERRYPRCDTPGAVSRGRDRGLRRYPCKGCGRTFNAATGAPLSGLHRKEQWLSFGEALATGETVKALAERCCVSMGQRSAGVAGFSRLWRRRRTNSRGLSERTRRMCWKAARGSGS